MPDKPLSRKLRHLLREVSDEFKYEPNSNPLVAGLRDEWFAKHKLSATEIRILTVAIGDIVIGFVHSYEIWKDIGKHSQEGE